MKGRVLTNDIILSGELNVNKNLHLETLQATENKTYNVPEGVDGWDEVIVNVPSEEINIESKTITENGTYNAPVGVAGYNPITVDVQPDLEDIKITENGTYTPTAGKDGFSEVEVDVDPNLQGLNVTENGTFYPTEGKDGFSYAIVDVPQRPAVVISKRITENGTYNVPTGVDGYNPVIVNVPQSGAVIESKTITENGTYNAPSGVDGFNPVTVNVESHIDELILPIQNNGTIEVSKPYGTDGFYPITLNVNVPQTGVVIDQVADMLNIGDTSTYVTVDLDDNLIINKKYLISVNDYNVINETTFTFTGTGQNINIPLYDGGTGRVSLTASTINLFEYGGDYRNIYVTISEIPAEMLADVITP